jgi:hypothetical protein
MTADEVRQLEETIAAVVRALRAEHEAALGILRERLFAVERDLAAYEARAGAPEAKGDNIHWLKRGAG